MKALNYGAYVVILDIGIKFGQTRSMCLQLQLWRPPKPINYRLHFKTMTTIVVMNLDKVLSNVTYVATPQLQSRCSGRRSPKPFTVNCTLKLLQ